MAPYLVESVGDLVAVTQNTGFSNGKYNEIWWRGHADAAWELVPAVFRNRRDHAFELQLIARFRTKAVSRYPSCPGEDDEAGWLFLMQHYGLHTRLLDWTESPLVAAFFAVIERPDCDAVLWALDPYALNRCQADKNCIFDPKDELALPLLRGAYDRESVPLDRVVAIVPKEVDVRMLVQLSYFTLHGSSQPLQNLNDSSTYLRKMIIPHDAKKQIKKQLHTCGVRLSNLFPDLGHLAQYLLDLYSDASE